MSGHRHRWGDRLMLHTAQSFLRTIYVSVGVFLILFVVTHIGGALYASHLGNQAKAAFQEGISQDLTHLKAEGDVVAQNPLVARYIRANDSPSMIALLRSEKDTRGVGLMGVVDKDGVVVGRSKSSGRRGDNVFLTDAIGRAVSGGASAESVEAPIGFDPDEITLTTGRPIMADGAMIGTLFANYLTDDAYADRFRDTYLPSGVEVAFYRKGVGVYGNSFADSTKHHLVHSYFNAGSNWINNRGVEQTVSFGTSDYYLLEPITFPGLEESPGGAILFIPRRDISDVANILTAAFTIITFLLVATFYHAHGRGQEEGLRYYLLLAVTASVVFILALLALYGQSQGYARLTQVPYPLYNSTIRLQPESGIYDLDIEQPIIVKVDTGDEAINAVEAILHYDPEAVSVNGIETDGSACSYFIEKTIDEENGVVTIACAVLKSAGEMGSLQIATPTTVPKQIGRFTLKFDPETKVLAADGLGTNVLRMAQDSSYSADQFDAAGPANDHVLTVYSPTHPNQSRWYNENEARFVWEGLDAVYAYAFDTEPDTIPEQTTTTTAHSITIPVPGDGVFYFHLQPTSGGSVAHYRIRVDRTPPSIPSIQLSSDTITAGDVVRLTFDAKDTGSGVQRNYYVDMGGRLFLPVGAELYVPFIEAGDKTITLRVYDDAGNYTERTQTVRVLPKR